MLVRVVYCRSLHHIHCYYSVIIVKGRAYMYSVVSRWTVLPSTVYKRGPRPLLIAARASQKAAMREDQLGNVPEDGWKVAKELAEEVREDTG